MGKVSKPKNQATSRLAKLPTVGARKYRLWFLLSSLMVALCATAWFEWRRLQLQRVDQAVRLAEQGQLGAVEPTLRAALEEDPENALLLRALALGLIGANELSQAEQVLARWCQVRPEDAEPYRLRMNLNYHSAQAATPGKAQQRLKELALEDGLRVIELDPTDVSTAQAVVWLCLANGRFEEADRICRGMVDVQPNAPDLLYLLARVCHARGDNAESKNLLDKLLGIRPQFTPGLLLRAILHNEADEAAQAIPLLRRVISEDDAFDQEARYQLAVALGRSGQTEEALGIMAEVQLDNLDKNIANPSETDSLPLRVRRAELLFACGRAEEALSSLQAVLRVDPDYATAHGLLAEYYERQGVSAKAAEHRRLAAPERVTE